MTRRAALALLAAAMLGGCASLPTGTDGLSLAQRRERLESVAAWEMRGRLVVDTGDARRSKAASTGGKTTMRSSSSCAGRLRNGVLQVSGRPDALTVTARGETRTLTDPETELSELIGWWLPVASLPDWLLGFPDAALAPRRSLGATARSQPSSSDSGTSRIRLTGSRPRERPAKSARAEPHRSDARRSRRCKLTIDDWRTATVCALNETARAQHNIGWGVAKR